MFIYLLHRGMSLTENTKSPDIEHQHMEALEQNLNINTLRINETAKKLCAMGDQLESRLVWRERRKIIAKSLQCAIVVGVVYYILRHE